MKLKATIELFTKIENVVEIRARLAFRRKDKPRVDHLIDDVAKIARRAQPQFREDRPRHKSVSAHREFNRDDAYLLRRHAVGIVVLHVLVLSGG